MEGLIDLILKNPLLLMLIIGGLFSMFSKKANPDEEEQTKGKQQRHTERSERQQAPHTPVPRQRRTQDPVVIERYKKTTLEDIEQEISETLSIEDQRKEQIKRLSAQYATDDYRKVKDNTKTTKQSKLIETEQSKVYNKQFKKEFTKSLTKEGLVNSIVMAEVLGSPRSKKPYENIIMKRR